MTINELNSLGNSCQNQDGNGCRPEYYSKLILGPSKSVGVSSSKIQMVLEIVGMGNIFYMASLTYKTVDFIGNFCQTQDGNVRRPEYSIQSKYQ